MTTPHCIPPDKQLTVWDVRQWRRKAWATWATAYGLAEASQSNQSNNAVARRITIETLRIRYYRHVRPRSRYWKKMGVRISKEKRKAERTASNQALSLNMMKFLNQTASGSTVPSESIASTSTQQTSEIPLGNAPDALSTERTSVRRRVRIML
ncbi:hypothetical protein EVAR_58528_1 [Eumeta japonica]|uniref:Uncharacterized protein n=1 Tax=Eumeta variegata TaxID=151549 RepID=A0A4C1Z589_EUMVA|nr:hypothetical protein EVAR_58528_1 [Eumeta japonica]